MQSQPVFFSFCCCDIERVVQGTLQICTCEEWNIGDFRPFSPKLRFGAGQFQVSPMMPTLLPAMQLGACIASEGTAHGALYQFWRCALADMKKLEKQMLHKRYWELHQISET